MSRLDMSDKTIKIIAVFKPRTIPINREPYYYFFDQTDEKYQKYLVSFSDYPFMLSRIPHNSTVEIQGSIGEKLSKGTELLNVKYRVLDE
jgi:hypothetical protein